AHRMMRASKATGDRTATTGRPSDHGRRPARRRSAAVLVTLVLALVTVAWTGPAAAQGSADVDADGPRITVTVNGIPGHQVRVELADDSIASTALIGPDGRAQTVFELPPGS